MIIQYKQETIDALNKVISNQANQLTEADLKALVDLKQQLTAATTTAQIMDIILYFGRLIAAFNGINTPDP